MKNKIKCVKRFGLLAALIAVIGFSFASCGGTDSTSTSYTSKDADDNTYKLEISAAKAAYKPADGDSYVLTITFADGSPDQISKGTITPTANGYDLKPAVRNSSTGQFESFSIIITNGGISGINGTITLEGGNDGTPPSGTLTPVSGGGNSGGSSSGSLGGTLTLSAQVYVETYGTTSSGDIKISYAPYSGSVASLKSDGAGSGSINNGKLSFSIGVPNNLERADANIDLSETGLDLYKDMKITPSNTMGAGLDFDDYILMKENTVVSSTAYDVEMVLYLYVDRNCTMTATGKTTTINNSMTVTASNVNLSLKQGWNAVTLKVTVKMNSSGTGGTGTASMKLGDSTSCKWTIMTS